MGSPSSEAGRLENEAAHIVRLTKGFEIQATEVTQLQYFLIMRENPSVFNPFCDDGYEWKPGYRLCPNHPVDRVSWEDTQNFVRRLNEIQERYVYRLPTEAEWEYAARGGVPSRFPYSFGYKDALYHHAWCNENSFGRNHAVATKRPNPFGLYDMYGNVWEWVWDYFGDYPVGSTIDPKGPTAGTTRAVRGGSRDSDFWELRSAFRMGFDPGYRLNYVGFRLVRTRR